MFDRFVAHNARQFPDRLALESASRRLTFRELERAVRSVAGALAPLRPMKLRLVAVACTEPLHHWLLLMGLSRLGIASASLPPRAEGTAAAAFETLAPDLMIEALDEGETALFPDDFLNGHDLKEGGPKEGGVEKLALNAAWFRRVLAGAPPVPTMQEESPDAPDALCRVALASGTRADPQPIGLTGAGVQAGMLRLLWLDAVTDRNASGKRPTLISTIHPASLSGFLAVCSALGAGASVRFPDPSRTGLAFAGSGPLLAILSPAHLGIVLDELPPRHAPRADLHLIVGGGLTSARLLERCYERLTPNVRLVYATDETGPVAEIEACRRGEGQRGEENLGQLLPGAQAQIVREDGALAALGETGEIRLRVTGGVNAYLPRLWARGGSAASYSAATAQRFKQGWFYPGDRGYLALAETPDENGTLELHFCGRTDDLVSLGGEKIDLAFLDRALARIDGIKEVACFVYQDTAGLVRLGCAAVRHSSGKLTGGTAPVLKALSERMRTLYPGLPPLPVFWADALPRDELGEPNRDRLAESVRDRIPAEAGGPVSASPSSTHPGFAYRGSAYPGSA